MPYWREGMYDQLLWRIRESVWKICRLVNKSVNSWTCQKVRRPKNTFFGSGIWKSSKSRLFWLCAQWCNVGVSFLLFFQTCVFVVFFYAKTKLGSWRKIIYLDHGPYGPQGPWAQPLFDCVAVPSGGFFSAKKVSKNKEVRISKKRCVSFDIFAIFANVELQLKLKIWKIAI